MLKCRCKHGVHRSHDQHIINPHLKLSCLSGYSCTILARLWYSRKHAAVNANSTLAIFANDSGFLQTFPLTRDINTCRFDGLIYLSISCKKHLPISSRSSEYRFDCSIFINWIKSACSIAFSHCKIFSNIVWHAVSLTIAQNIEKSPPTLLQVFHRR